MSTLNRIKAAKTNPASAGQGERIQQTPFSIDSRADAYYAGRMDWITLIEELIASGMTQQSIADAVTRMGPRRVTQPTIYRIKNGMEPKYSVGAALIRLHRSRRRTRRHGRRRQG